MLDCNEPTAIELLSADVAAFRDIWRQDFDEEISESAARQRLLALVDLMRMLVRAPPG
ncbi:MAG: hypothetical protein ISP45_04115 [Reyranella sp.]|nr:hypothetical protein [Reyranella sp.]